MEKKIDHKKLAKTSRNKGHGAERLYAKLFRELGYKFCLTARQASRITDDAGIDLAHLPFNVQIKAGFHKGLNPAKVLGIIDERLPKLFPPENPIHTYPNLLIHRNQIGRGNRRVAEDDLLYLKVKDFEKIIMEYADYRDDKMIGGIIPIKGNMKKGVSYKEILSKKGHFEGRHVIYHSRPNATHKDYSHLAIMSFEFFSQLIKKDD